MTSIVPFIGSNPYDEYGQMYGNTYGYNGCSNGSFGTTFPRATRNATAANQKTLARNIASSHGSELKEAYEYLEDGNVSAFQSTINGIVSNESSKSRMYNISDSEIESAVEAAYQQVIGADYDTSIAGTKSSSFESGFNQFLFGGIFGGDTKSAAEYSAERRGTKVNANEETQKNIGRAAGLATTIGTTAAVGTGLAVAGGLTTWGAIGGALSAACPFLLPIVAGVGIAMGVSYLVNKNK